MLILYLLPACPPSFVISLLLLIRCNVMKWLEAAPCGRGGGGLCLAAAAGVGATSRLFLLKPIRLSRHGQRTRMGEWRREDGGQGDSRHQPRTERLGDRCRGCRGGPPSEMAASSQPHHRPPLPKCMCNYTPTCPPSPTNESSHNT